jgi:hypothetical protein
LQNYLHERRYNFHTSTGKINIFFSAGYDYCIIDAAMLYLKQEELLNSP